MNKIKSAFLLVMVSLSSLPVFGHYLWIEAGPVAVKGEKHEVKIFYGEYENSRREEAGKRLEEVNGIQAFVIEPGGKKLPLALEKSSDHYLSSFSPSRTGTYQVFAVNDVRDVVDWTAYDLGIVKPVYYARLEVRVTEAGKPATAVPAASGTPHQDFDIVVLPSPAYETGHPISMNLFKDGKELEKGKIMVYAPNGWMKELERNGQAYSFIPADKGMYVIESVYKEKTPGTYKGQNYEAIRHRTVLTIYVR